MTQFEKNTILDWANHEVERRTKAYQRVPIEDEHALCRTAGALQAAERTLTELTKLLSKM